MIIICENCGKKYRMDPKQMPDKRRVIPCKTCGHSIVIGKNVEKKPAPKQTPVNESMAPKTKKPKGNPAETVQTFDFIEPIPESWIHRLKSPSLRMKMLLLFFLIPTVLMVVASVLYLSQLEALSSQLTGESLAMATKMTEDIVENRALSVASQARSFLLTHPNMKKAFFNYDMQFRRVALQKIGLTGHTALYEIPEGEETWKTWIHMNPDIVGKDIRLAKSAFGAGFDQFYRIFTAIKNGGSSKGFFTGKDAKGEIREHYIVCVPVEGTDFAVMATSFPGEFTHAVSFMQKRAGDIAAGIRNIVLGILAATVVLIGVVVSLYGLKVSRRIRYLTDITGRISIGELDIKINSRNDGDEIDELAGAFGRMQESIRLSMNRMRRFKN